MILAALFAAAVLWTVLVATWPPLQAFDSRLVAPPMNPKSAAAQIASAFALLTWQGLEYAALLGLAIWAYRRRLRALSASLVITVALGLLAIEGMKFAFGRPRPDPHLDVITAVGYSFPSGHLVGVVSSCIAVGAVFAVTRRSPRRRLAWQVSSVALVVLVAFDRWLLGAHYVSDLVGGTLVGALVAVTALVVTGVSVPVTHEIVQEYVRDLGTPDPSAASVDAGRRCAVIYNPVRVTDWVTFRRHVEYELRIRGWQQPLWFETTAADPGHSMTARAVAEGVDLVLGAGGDGTIRVICSGLAGTGVAFGLIPAGTGNLLARNLGIPLDEGAALTVAFDGVDKPIDLVRLSVDDRPPEHFVVMAGIGIDAVIMQGTNPELKKAVGPAAYFVSAAQHANHPALHVSITVDDRPALRRKAHVIVVGNVGLLSGNIQLLPDARADDGLLDVLIASPRTVADWARLILRVLTRRRRPDDQLDRMTGRRVTIRVVERDHYQLDGDTAGECNTMVAEVEPGALLLRVPRSRLTAGQLGVGEPTAVPVADSDSMLSPV